MLASDEDGDALDALKFSLASDIVELVVLTTDQTFLQTLREAVGPARRLWHVPSPDKVSDLLLAGEVGIAVLDVQSLRETANVFVAQVKRQFPDLVIVVAGRREDETTLASLISSGMIYRFIHKPMSPARAKLFAEAAIKKFEEQRRRAAESPASNRAARGTRIWLVGGGAGILAAIAAVTWMLNRSADTSLPASDAAKSAAAESPLLARAAAALAANRLTEPKGDNALELYLAVQAQNPADPGARAGLAEVHERLLARAENALLEERLDEAAAAIETARNSGVEGGRIAFMTAQLAKSREQVKAAQAQIQAQTQAQTQAQVQARAHVEAAAPDKATTLLALAKQRMSEGHLIDPDRDNARFYIEQALSLDANSDSALDAKTQLASQLLGEARSAIDRRDFARAASLIEAANGIASAASFEAAQGLLVAARRRADTDSWTQLLTSANERLLQDRLIEPANDSAKYYYLTLRQIDPGNAALASLQQDLGSRLIAKARRALILAQADAAKSWLDEATAVGFVSGDSAAVRRDLEAALVKQNFMTTLIPTSQLTLLKSVQPIYPAKALAAKMEGWVDVAFTIAASGKVQDAVVRSSSVPITFDEAALKAVLQWRYKPFLRDDKPVPVRTEIRIRFALS
ncbi:MAG TPA: TonB family protein [Steroidobacteraceae bacterium]